MSRSIHYALGMAVVSGLAVCGGCGDDESASTPTASPTASPTATPTASPTCGDGECGADETCESCEDDCGPCGEPTCGDGQCNGDESCETCEEDCGECPITECGDGIDNDGDGYVDWQYDLGCANERDQDEAAGPRDEEGGFTTFDGSPSSQYVFVSSSEGDDANDGSSPEQAVQTLARGAELVRDGEHDFLLLRRGDTWRGETLGRFKSGQDANHPLVVASYGESTDRPRLEVDGHFINHDGHPRSFVTVTGLEIVSFPKIPGDPSFDGATGGGFRYVGGGTNLLIEDCHFLYAELVVQSCCNEHYEDVEVRRNVIELNYHVDTCGQNNAFRPSGHYASHVTNLLIEDNVFDHNGWNEDVATACATMYNHNMYLNADGLVVRGNVIARASSMGIKMRSDATGDADDLLFEDNLVVDGEIGFGIGGNTSEPDRFSNVTVRSNVFSQIGLGNPTDRNFSWMLGIADNATATIEDNHFLHQPWYDNAFGIHLGGGSATDITVSGNLFYDLRRRSLWVETAAGWSGIAVTGNTFVDPTHGSCLVDHVGGFSALSYSDNRYSSSSGSDWFCVDGAGQTLSQWQSSSGETGASTWSGTFVDPDRTTGSYAESIGLTGTLEGFLEAARGQSRLDWQDELTASAVNDYIRAGFAEN
ncbi:MAG: right-handed parallel beta-helix repeat-containing protein [Deltaproteobacteria bacterium]|jgi:hypothetical protein|nr:right-handed parallel beta-helix repeat-containing protein [Deltaproteobacteria bacterium]MBW2533221.1 right-handed parallel beta-helix repeat-containing protein [Deltaproteobacteria bacterium]